MKNSSNLSDKEFNQILCPVLRVGVKEGMLTPDQRGVVEETELRNYMSFLGWQRKSIMSKVVKDAYDPAKPNEINITKFRGRGFDHGSSSGSINNLDDDNQKGFYRNRFDHFLSFASDTGEFGYQELAIAAQDFHENPINWQSFSGRNKLLLEFAALLEIFGADNNNDKQKTLTVNDIKALWLESRFPENWQAPKSSFYGNASAAKGFAKMISILGRQKLKTLFKRGSQLANR